MSEYAPKLPVESKYAGREAVEAALYGYCAHCGRGDAKSKCGGCGQIAYCKRFRRLFP